MKIIVKLLFFGFLTQHAYSDLVLSNTDTVPGRQTLARTIGVEDWRATPFTTDGFDYTLNSVVSEIADSGSIGTLFMEIWSTSPSYAPGSSLGRLTLTGDLSAEKTFTGAIALDANTSYFVVTGVDSGGGLAGWQQSVNVTDAFGPDFNVNNGSWLLETQSTPSPIQESYSSANLGSSWGGDTLSAPLRMTIDATVVPEPAAIFLLGLGGCLTLLSRRIFLD